LRADVGDAEAQVDLQPAITHAEAQADPPTARAGVDEDGGDDPQLPERGAGGGIPEGAEGGAAPGDNIDQVVPRNCEIPALTATTILCLIPTNSGTAARRVFQAGRVPLEEEGEVELYPEEDTGDLDPVFVGKYGEQRSGVRLAYIIMYCACVRLKAVQSCQQRRSPRQSKALPTGWMLAVSRPGRRRSAAAGEMSAGTVLARLVVYVRPCRLRQ
jgi:hypothetical protein